MKTVVGFANAPAQLYSSNLLNVSRHVIPDHLRHPAEVERYAKWFKFLVYLPYAPSLAWVQLKINIFGNGPIFDRLAQTFKNKGLIFTTRKIIRYFTGGSEVASLGLQVETMGADGERPHISEGLQELMDVPPGDSGREDYSYDIEDMDANRPHMDVPRQ